MVPLRVMGQIPTKWVINWSDYDTSRVEDSLWDVATFKTTYMPIDGHIPSQFIYVGSYYDELVDELKGMIATFNEFGRPSPPAGGLRVYDDGIDYNFSKMSFYGVLPYYTRRGVIGVLGGFYVGGYVKQDGSPRDVLFIRFGRLLNPIWSYRYDFGDSDEAIFKIFRNGKRFGANVPIFTVAGVGYTTYNRGNSIFLDRNILFMGIDSLGNPSFACIYGGKGTDVGTYLYKIDDTTYMVLGYSDSYISSRRYGVFVAKVRTTDCKPKWIKVFYDVDSSVDLIPYAISKNQISVSPPIDGNVVFHITGTAVDKDADFESKFYLFLLTLTSEGEVVNYKWYNTTANYPNLLGFEHIVVDNDIVVVGGTSPHFVFIDTLPKFGQGGVQPLGEYGGDAIMMRLEWNGDIVWAKRYFSRYEKSSDIDIGNSESFLFTLDWVDDSTVIGAGVILRASSEADKDLQYYSVKARFSDGVGATDPACYGSISVRMINRQLQELTDDKYIFTLPKRYAQPLSWKNLSGFVEDCGSGVYFPFSAISSGPQSYDVGCGGKGEYEIYTVDGRLVRKGEGREDLKDLPKGVYMVKRGDRVYKIIRR